MNKTELIKLVAEETNLTQKDVDDIFDRIFSIMKYTLIRGESVVIKDFCSFRKIVKKARNGKNPKTGETIKIPTKNGIKLNVSKNLKEKLNK